MADQPQSPNAGRISAMLQDLANQRNAQQGTPPPTTPRPMTVPPPNLPVSSTPVAPPKPVPPPMQPPGAVMPPKPVPPPAPREMPVAIPPKPAPPPIAPRPIVPPTPIVPPPVQPPAAPTPVTSELRTMSGDIGQIQVGRPPVGVRPVAPVAPSPTPAAAPIVIPAGTGSSHRGRLLLIIGLAVVVIIIAVVVLTSLGGGSSTATPTPSTSPSPTAALQGKTLSSYFGQASGTDTTAPEAGLFKNIDEPAAITLPAALASAVGSDRVWLIFGQNELYGSSGQLLTASTVESRSVAVYSLNDVTAAQQAMQAWETATMTTDLAGFLGYDSTHPAATGFLDGTHNQASVRYLNFPYPDHSIDWGIVTGSNGQSYLVIAGSRQSMSAVIDTLAQ